MSKEETVKMFKAELTKEEEDLIAKEIEKEIGI